MKRLTCVLPYFVVCFIAPACASSSGGAGMAPPSQSPQTKYAVIVADRDANNVCKTSTTPSTRPSKSRRDFVRWTVVDNANCTDRDHEFEIVFQPGENPFEAGCDLQDDNRVQCRLRDDVTQGMKIKYSVRLVATGEVEDPELEIAM